MDTLVKIKDNSEGKKLLSYLKSLSVVDIIGSSDDYVSITTLKDKIKKAERSESIPIEKAEVLSTQWKKKSKV